MAITKIVLVFTIVFILSCCSNTKLEKIKTISDLYFDEKDKINFKYITKEELSKINYPIIEIRTNEILKQSLFLRITNRGRYENFISGSGQSFTKHGALLIRTNGFNSYLLSVEQDINSPLIKLTKPSKWPNHQKRKYTFLLSDHSSETIEFDCFLNVKPREALLIHDSNHELFHIKEECKSNKRLFSNDYWVDANGFVWKSNQWISLDNQIAEVFVLKKHENNIYTLFIILFIFFNRMCFGGILDEADIVSFEEDSRTRNISILKTLDKNQIDHNILSFGK